MLKPLFPLSVTFLSLLAGSVVSFAAPPAAQPKAPPPPKSSAVSAAEQGQRLFTQAIQQTKDGQTVAAENTYRKLLKLFPQAGSAWANLGLLAAHDNRLAEAEADLLKAVKFEPKTTAFWAQLSSIQLQRSRFKESEANARKALTLVPKDKFALGNLASALMQQNRYKDAVAPLKSLQAIDSKNQQVALSLVYALSHSNQKREALVIAQKMAAQAPSQAKLQLMVADLASQTSNTALAQKAYAAASRLNPKDTQTGINAAIAAEMAGHPAQSKAQLEKLIKANPKAAMAHFQLGRLYYLYPKLTEKPSPANYKKAEVSFRDAMVLEPKNPLYLSNFGLAIMLQGPARFGDAEKIFEATLSVAPQNTMAHMGLGYIAEQKQNADGALKEYRAILAYAPDADDARRNLARLLYVTGEKEKAYTEFQTLAQKATGADKITAIKDLAAMKSDSQDWTGAQKEYEQALALSPKDAEALVGLGKSLEALKQPAKAQANYEAALAADPKNTAAYEALGTLFLNQRKTAEATVLYQKYSAAFPESNAARWQLAQLYQEQKRDDEALREMRKLTLSKTDPTRVTYLLSPANLLMARQRYGEAVTELKNLTAEYRGKDESRELRYTLADAEEKAGQSADAEKTLITLVDEAKDTESKVRAYTAVASFYERGNHPESAVQRYEDALTIAPDSTVARVGLRRVFDTLKKPEAAPAFLESLALAGTDGPDKDAVRAVSQFYIEDNTPGKYLAFAQRAAAKYPKNPDALNLYAQALLQNNSDAPPPEVRQQIADLYQQVTILDPKDADAFYRLGIQKEAMGKKEEAISAYKSAALIEDAKITQTQSIAKAKSALTRLDVTLPAPKPKTIEPPVAGGPK